VEGVPTTSGLSRRFAKIPLSQVTQPHTTIQQFTGERRHSDSLRPAAWFYATLMLRFNHHSADRNCRLFPVPVVPEHVLIRRTREAPLEASVEPKATPVICCAAGAWQIVVILLVRRKSQPVGVRE